MRQFSLPALAKRGPRSLAAERVATGLHLSRVRVPCNVCMMRYSLYFCLAAILAVAAPAARAERMDGTKWKVKVTPDEESAKRGAKGFEDELIFSDGRFTSIAMQIHGFKPGPYRYETEDTDVEWSADKQNDATDMVGWGGRVDGKTTRGNFHWQKKDGMSLFFKFTGTKE